MRFEYKFSVDEDKGIVVAYCTNMAEVISNMLTRDEHNKAIMDMVYIYNDYYEIEKFLKKYHLTTPIARAQCDDYDEFDEEFGKMLALKRLDGKVAEICGRYYNKMLNDVSHIYETLHDKMYQKYDMWAIAAKQERELVGERYGKEEY